MFEDRKYFLSYGKHPIPDSDSESQKPSEAEEKKPEVKRKSKVLKKGVSEVTKSALGIPGEEDSPLKRKATKMGKLKSMSNANLKNMLFNRKSTTDKKRASKNASIINEETNNS